VLGDDAGLCCRAASGQRLSHVSRCRTQQRRVVAALGGGHGTLRAEQRQIVLTNPFREPVWLDDDHYIPPPPPPLPRLAAPIIGALVLVGLAIVLLAVGGAFGLASDLTLLLGVGGLLLGAGLLICGCGNVPKTMTTTARSSERPVRRGVTGVTCGQQRRGHGPSFRRDRECGEGPEAPRP
jgi:hypothetical protein